MKTVANLVAFQFSGSNAVYLSADEIEPKVLSADAHFKGFEDRAVRVRVTAKRKAHY